MASASSNSRRKKTSLTQPRLSESTLKLISDITPPPDSALTRLSTGLVFPLSGAISMRILTYLAKGNSPPSNSAIAVPNQPCTSFVHFTKLPNEIQDMIWQYAVLNDSPRIVKLSCKHDESWNKNRLPTMVALSKLHRQQAYDIHGYLNARAGIIPTFRRNHNLCFLPGVDTIYLPRLSCTVCSDVVDWLEECPPLVQAKSVAVRRGMIYSDRVVDFLRSCVNLEAVFVVHETVRVCWRDTDATNPFVLQYLGTDHPSYYKRKEKQELERFERKLARAEGKVAPYIFSVRELESVQYRGV